MLGGGGGGRVSSVLWREGKLSSLNIEEKHGSNLNI